MRDHGLFAAAELATGALMETTIKTDVIIVGAGPTGLSLAVQLMCYDIDFVIFDKKEGVTDLSNPHSAPSTGTSTIIMMKDSEMRKMDASCWYPF